jgi:hypothetical protein
MLEMGEKKFVSGHETVPGRVPDGLTVLEQRMLTGGEVAGVTVPEISALAGVPAGFELRVKSFSRLSINQPCDRDGLMATV